MAKKKKPPVEKKVEVEGESHTAILSTGPHSHIAQKDLPAIMEVLDDVRRIYGRLTARTLLNYHLKYKPKVLKKYFTANVKEAAEHYWLIESFRIINAVEIHIKGVRNDKPVKYLIRFKDAQNDTDYQPITTILTDEQKTEQMLQRAMDQLEAWQHRYQNLVTFSNWFREAHVKVGTLVFQLRREQPSKLVDNEGADFSSADPDEPDENPT